MKQKDLISPDHVSDFLLLESRSRGDVWTLDRLQKMLYYSQAWFLALHDKPLFQEDFQFNPISGMQLFSQTERFDKWENLPIMEEIKKLEITNDTVKKHLIEIIEVFGTEKYEALKRMSYNEAHTVLWKSPEGWMGRINTPIPKPGMQRFYKKVS